MMDSTLKQVVLVWQCSIPLSVPKLRRCCGWKVYILTLDYYYVYQNTLVSSLIYNEGMPYQETESISEIVNE